jgi:hypothetical protein
LRSAVPIHVSHVSRYLALYEYHARQRATPFGKHPSADGAGAPTDFHWLERHRSRTECDPDLPTPHL